MNYPQLIQFKRLEERAFIFLNGRQLMLGFMGMFIGMNLAQQLSLTGWPLWIISLLMILVGIALGGVYRGLYGYQYIRLLFRTWGAMGQRTDNIKLYHRTPDADIALELGAPGGGALVSIQGAQTRRRRAPGPGEPFVYHLTPIDLSQYPPQVTAGFLQHWSGFWSGLRAPTRIVVHSTPFKIDHVLKSTQTAALMAQEPWRVRALSNYGRFLEDLVSRASMYQTRHEALVWARNDTEAHATMASMAGYLGVSGEDEEMTPLLQGEYEIHADHLRPLDPRQPYIILMVSHEFSGEWSWIDPLVTTLRQSFPVSIAIDIEKTMASNEALRKLVQFENVVLDVLHNNKTGRDPKAEGALQDIQLAMAKSNAGLALHFVTMAVAVKGATLAEARNHVEGIRTMTAARLSLVTIPGGQGEILKFFTPTARKEINLPEISHNVTSDGMAVLSGPLGFRRRSETDGVLWGLGSTGGQDTYPIYWSGFGPDPEKPGAYHGLILGKSGYGKTVAIQTMVYREALRGTQIIFMEPQGHSERLTALVGEGASYNALSLRSMTLNPLDPISDNLNEQKAFQINLYRLMLKQVDPHRQLTMQEAGLLDAALDAVYRGLGDLGNVAVEYVPRLETLVRHLYHLGAKALASDLELNFVKGSMGAVYNQATNLDIGLEADVVSYDFKDIPECSRTLIYTLILSRVQRAVRVGGRVRRRIIAIDEFGWLAQEAMLAETVAMWFKTFRTFGCGVWIAEQDLIRLTGGKSGDLSGHSIVGNSAFQLFFYHEPSAAAVVAETFPNIAPYRRALESFKPPHITGRAEAILRLPDGAYHNYMVMSPTEKQYLIGS